MVEWVFFDIGNVILNDDPAMVVLYEQLYQSINSNGRHVSFDELLRLREDLIIQHRDGKHYKTVGINYLGEQRWWTEFQTIRKYLADDWEQLSPLMPGIIPIIGQLASKYKLGLIANQPREAKTILEKLNLMPYFQVNAISAFVGAQKPDMKIFQFALEAAKCLPEHAVMIGDRIDNDIIPAKSLGMRTIWLKLPLELKGFVPVTDFQKRYMDSVRRASASRIPPTNRAEEPDYVAESFEDVLNYFKQ